MKEESQEIVQDVAMMKIHLWARSRSRRGFHLQFLGILLKEFKKVNKQNLKKVFLIDNSKTIQIDVHS